MNGHRAQVILRTGIIVMLLAAWSVDLAAQEEEKKGDSGISWLKSLLSPGPLSNAHQEIDESKACDACHIGRKGLDDRRCLECHETLRERMKNKAGYHGKLKDPCQACHTEHQGRKADITGLDPDKFNHDLAQFRVTGKHHDLKCEACHAVKKKERKYQARYFIG